MYQFHAWNHVWIVYASAHIPYSVSSCSTTVHHRKYILCSTYYINCMRPHINSDSLCACMLDQGTSSPSTQQTHKWYIITHTSSGVFSKLAHSVRPTNPGYHGAQRRPDVGYDMPNMICIRTRHTHTHSTQTVEDQQARRKSHFTCQHSQSYHHPLTASTHLSHLPLKSGGPLHFGARTHSLSLSLSLCRRAYRLDVAPSHLGTWAFRFGTLAGKRHALWSRGDGLERLAGCVEHERSWLPQADAHAIIL